MKRMITALTLGTALVAVAACSGGGGRDELTLVAYFSALEDIKPTVPERADPIAPPDIGGSDATLDERKSALVSSLEETRAVVHEFLAELEDMNPPDKAQELHGDSLAAGRDLVKAIDRIIADVANVADVGDFPPSDIFVFFAYPEFVSAGERLDAICANLQKLADDEAVDVDLGCE